MTEAIGWWDYDDTIQPTLINRESHERIRMGRRVWMIGKRPGQRWLRLDYMHRDLTFPILACWMPEQGHIVVDYLASAAVWRRSTNSELQHPPYGVWARVDNCLLDALWCWPGNLQRLQTARIDGEGRQGVIGLIGGWCNGEWRPELQRISVVRNRWQDSFCKIEQDETDFARLPLDRLSPLNEPAPAPWTFVDPTDSSVVQAVDHTTWNGFTLAPKEDLSNFEKRFAHSLPFGSASVAIGGFVPHLRTRDDSRILFPLSAHIRPYGKTMDIPGLGVIRFALFEKDMMGILLSVSMGRSRKSLIPEDLGELSVSYQTAHPYIRRTATERKNWKLPGVTPNVALRGEYTIIDHGRLNPPASRTEVKYERPGPWVLSASARRRATRTLQDAFLFWDGTTRRPDCWSVVKPEILSYRHHGTVRLSPNLMGGWRVGYDIAARLGSKPGNWLDFSAEQPWTTGGFRLGPFGGWLRT